jgi:hypothetical protein
MDQNDSVAVTSVRDIELELLKSEVDMVTHEPSSIVNVKSPGRKPRSAVTNFLVRCTGKENEKKTAILNMASSIIADLRYN